MQARFHEKLVEDAHKDAKTPEEMIEKRIAQAQLAITDGSVQSKEQPIGRAMADGTIRIFGPVSWSEDADDDGYVEPGE